MNTKLIMTIPIKRGKSPFNPACTVALTKPPQMRILALQIQPLKSSLKDKNCNVIAGKDTFFITWLNTILFLLLHGAFAKST